jgi:hypothetical protein
LLFFFEKMIPWRRRLQILFLHSCDYLVSLVFGEVLRMEWGGMGRPGSGVIWYNLIPFDFSMIDSIFLARLSEASNGAFSSVFDSHFYSLFES